MREALALVVAILRDQVTVVARLRQILAELLLGGRDQTEIMFRVLVVILGGDRIAG
jgi:hypothetical protein